VNTRKTHMITGSALMLSSLGMIALGLEQHVYLLIALASLAPGLALIITGYRMPEDTKNDDTD
jgi:heme O synthase-like polyprenyltransferase